MTIRKRKLLALPFAVLFCGCSHSWAWSGAEDRALAVFFPRYETVVSSTTGVLDRIDFSHPEKDFGRNYLGLPFIYLIGGLKAVGPHTLKDLYGASAAVVTGARNFTKPAGLGMVGSRTSYIAILSPGGAGVVTAQFAKVHAAESGGLTVWDWSTPPSEGYAEPARFAAAVVRNAAGESFFVMANSDDDFRDVSGAVADSAADAAPVTGTAGSSELTALRSYAYWGWRLIRSRNGQASGPGLDHLPAAAASVKMYTEFDSGRLLFDIAVPEAPEADAKRQPGPPPGLPSSDALMFRRAAAGVWRAEIRLDGPRATTAIFQALACLGYGVVL
ncbi:MAG: hypothetical protein WBY44_28655 [Bryobacteraceae bacterium]